MQKTYIGITGFTDSGEIRNALEICSFDSSENGVLMAGVLASQRTLNGLQVRRPLRYPKPERISEIFVDHPHCLNLIHYHCPTTDLTANHMEEVMVLGGKHCNGLQLNVTWPSPKELAVYRAASESKKDCIVLQIGNEAFRQIDYNPKHLTKKIATEYADFVDYILLDPSGGEGKKATPETIHKYLDALYDAGLNDSLGFSFAGGLSGGGLIDYISIFKEYPGVSIDTESRVRDDQTDELVPGYIKHYLSMARILMIPSFQSTFA
jgi:hypothetical protein